MTSNIQWYVAEIVEEITVEGDPRNVIHKNLVLVRGDSPEEAYSKAVDLGGQANLDYLNSAGKSVTVRFRGISHLEVLSDGLQHGAELRYDRKVSVSEEQIQAWIPSREELAVFTEPEARVPTDCPDYCDAELIAILQRLSEETGD